MNTRYLENLYNGIVVDNNDKRRLGRIRVQGQSLYETLPIEHIPWASPVKRIDGREYIIPNVGDPVTIRFPNMDIYHPEYISAKVYNPNLAKKLQDLSEDEYKEFIALVLDHKTQIYADNEQLNIDYLYNRMRIKNDGMYLELKDNTQKLMIGTEDSDQPLLMSKHFFDFMDEFFDTLALPTSLVGNLSAPVLKPQLDILCQKYKALKSTFLSENVFVVDNKKIKKLK